MRASKHGLARHLYKVGLVALLAALLSAVAGAQTSSVWDGVYTEAQAQRGRRLYLKECTECHGEKLRGGETAPGLVGKELVSFWSEASVGALFESIRETMPEENPGGLSDQAYADILAYLFQANKFPVGEEELDENVERLWRISITPEPPE